MAFLFYYCEFNDLYDLRNLTGPVIFSVVAGWLGQCAIIAILYWIRNRKVEGDASPLSVLEKLNYPGCAFVGALALEKFMWDRCIYALGFKDHPWPESWHFQNLWLVGGALLLVAPVLRHGTVSQRVVAVSLSVLPVIYIVGEFHFIYTELATP